MPSSVSSTQVSYEFSNGSKSDYEDWHLSRNGRESSVKIYKMKRVAKGILSSDTGVFNVRFSYIEGGTYSGSFDLEGAQDAMDRLECFDY